MPDIQVGGSLEYSKIIKLNTIDASLHWKIWFIAPKWKFGRRSKDPKFMCRTYAYNYSIVNLFKKIKATQVSSEPPEVSRAL